MNWLHFSDFHFSTKSAPQMEAVRSMLHFLKAEQERNPQKYDAVFLVGDIAWSGKEGEFVLFERDFLHPLLQIPGVTEAAVFAVPGNHDLDCENTPALSWEAIGTRNHPVFFAEDSSGKTLRRQRAELFHQYSAFVSRNNIRSPQPEDEVSHLFPSAIQDCDILCVNTSFFCDKEEKSDDPIVPCPLTSIRDRIHRRKTPNRLIILGHHPIQCFRHEHQRQFESLLVDEKAIYLHGHLHEPKVIPNADGSLQAIGFGATYIEPLGQSGSGIYRNSFATGQIEEKLRVKGYSWDPSVGRWEDATRTQFSTAITGKTYDGSHLILELPTTVVTKQPQQLVPTLSKADRRAPEPKSIITLNEPSHELWTKLFSLSSLIQQDPKARTGDVRINDVAEVDGKLEVVTEAGDGRSLFICIPAMTHLLSLKEMESFNTRLDSEDYSSVIVVSLGKISNDALGLYHKLKAKKQIEILTNSDLSKQWRLLTSIPQHSAIANLDGASFAVHLVLDDELLLLVRAMGDGGFFKILDSNATVLPPSHPTVVKVRSRVGDYSNLPYAGDHSVTFDIPHLFDFDEEAYLRACFSDYNAIKYAALANYGLRFGDFSLEDIYINATASEVDSKRQNRLDAILDDHLAAYPASEKLKTQIKQQYIAFIEHDERRESSQAREFCQKYGAVLLTGDPGSGKTCFVKSEILAYCRRVRDKSLADDWHSLHIPVMIPLARAAAEPDLEDVGLMAVGARLLENKGLRFPWHQMEPLLNQGKLAIFFDGLDEVVSVEKRAVVVQHINETVTKHLAAGNRIVVTSRPAAINVVNLLPTLRQLELRGLSDTEISRLARNILSMRVADGAEGAVIDATGMSSSDSRIVSQLLADCEEKSGVRRFASNPLLLTLLVMIYANSGAPSAKRHVVYEEAVKTLASVRGRDAGHEPVSVQDLRERLGAVALSVYRKESGFLPTRREVTEIVKAAMIRQLGPDVNLHEAERFVQKVAESTGLIAIGGDDDSAVVTFMHHSFMEYFAAVGLSRELSTLDMRDLITQPRWVEILTLLAGIIGEVEDIAPILTRLLGPNLDYGDVDARFLMFALDCALECEVASEATIKLINNTIKMCIESGPAKSDPWIRSEIGARMSQLIEAAGPKSFEDTLVKMVRASKPDACAASISLAGYACAKMPKSNLISQAIDTCATRTDEAIMCAMCEAAGRVEWLRGPVMQQVIARCLKKSNHSKRSAYEAIVNIPGAAAKHWADVINGLDEKAPAVKRLAAKAALEAGLDSDLVAMTDSKRDVIANALQLLSEGQSSVDGQRHRIKKDTVTRLLDSAVLRNRLIGIQLLPLTDAGWEVAYEKTMQILFQSDDSQEIASALWAIRSSPGIQSMVKIPDLRRFAYFLENGTSNVRRASISVLGMFCADSTAVKPLLEHAKRDLNTGEFEAVLDSLARAKVHQDEVVSLLEREIESRFEPSPRRNEHYQITTIAVLRAAKTLGKNLNMGCVSRIQKAVEDFREHESLRCAALLAFSATTVPSAQAVSFLVHLFTTRSTELLTELVQSLGIFAQNCRQSVEYVMACVEHLSGLREHATQLHKRLVSREVTYENEYLVTELRDGISEISQIIVTFEEFISTTGHVHKNHEDAPLSPQK